MEGEPTGSRSPSSLAVEELAVFLSSRQQELPTDLGSSFLLDGHTEAVKIPADIWPFSSDNEEKPHLQHAVALPFKQPAVAESTSVGHHVTVRATVTPRPVQAQVYLQCLLGRRSSAMALCPQGHLKKRLMASCHRNS